MRWQTSSATPLTPEACFALDYQLSIDRPVHSQVYQLSIDRPDHFWGTLAKSRLTWDAPFDKVSDCDLAAGKIDWFLGGRLNASVQCLDRHIAARGHQTALIWEGDEPGNVQRVSIPKKP